MNKVIIIIIILISETLWKFSKISGNHTLEMLRWDFSCRTVAAAVQRSVRLHACHRDDLHDAKSASACDKFWRHSGRRPSRVEMTSWSWRRQSPSNTPTDSSDRRLRFCVTQHTIQYVASESRQTFGSFTTWRKGGPTREAPANHGNRPAQVSN